MLIVFCIFISLLHNVYSANILVLMGCTSHSHQLWNGVIVNALAERGHTLTVASVDANDSTNPNVTYIHMEGAYNEIDAYYKDLDGNFDNYGPLSNLRLLHNLELLECKGIFQSKGFQEASNLDQNFNLILFDISAGPCIYRLIQKYPGIPVIGVSAFKMDPYIHEIVGGHSYPGYISYFLDRQEVPMNLWNRLANSATYAFAYLKYVTEASVERLAQNHVHGPKPTLNSLFKRVKIALINTHPSIDYAQSLPPNIIEVGGLHIKEPQRLPDDIGAFIESSVKGAVLISLGSNAVAEAIGQKRIEAFLNVIKSFDQHNFLWKIERGDIIKDIPRNLLIGKWLPQNDILANPKMQAFLTHAGSLSMQEAIWHGVPVIAMPLFLDQFANAHNAQLKGCGFEVEFKNLSTESLLEAFSKVLNDKSNKNRMKELQSRFRNRQNKPLDTALWWIEYFLRDPNAEHFNLSSRNLSFFVANSFDIIVIVLFICIVFVINAWVLLNSFKAMLSKSKKKDLKCKDLLKKEV